MRSRPELRALGVLLPVFTQDSLVLALPVGSDAGAELVLLDIFQIPFDGGILHTGLSTEGFIRLQARLVDEGFVHVDTDGHLRHADDSRVLPGIDLRLQ